MMHMAAATVEAKRAARDDVTPTLKRRNNQPSCTVLCLLSAALPVSCCVIIRDWLGSGGRTTLTRQKATSLLKDAASFLL